MQEIKRKKLNPSITWTVTHKKGKKNFESLAILWILAITLAVIIYIFSKNYISSLVVLSGALALFFHYINAPEEQSVSYSATLKGFKVNNILYPYKNIKRYNIVENEDGQKLLLLDLISVITPDIVAPLEDVNEEELDFYLSRFVEEDPEMKIPATHLLAERLGM